MRPSQSCSPSQLSCPLTNAHLNARFQGRGTLNFAAAVLAQPGQLLWPVEDA